MTMTDYDDFKHRIVSVLRRYKYGLTWTEIREKAHFQQRVPYNRWVKQMEKDIGLRRVKDARGILWLVK